MFILTDKKDTNKPMNIQVKMEFQVQEEARREEENSQHWSKFIATGFNTAHPS